MWITCKLLLLVGLMPAVCSGTCASLKEDGYGDGEYLMDVGNTLNTISVYCYMMGARVTADGAPFTYITLNTENKAEWISKSTLVTTVFTKVRLITNEDNTYTIDTADCECTHAHPLGCFFFSI
jgi:hypothetical protein